MMKLNRLGCGLLLLWTAYLVGCATAGSERVPDPSLAIPEGEAERAYLGLSSDSGRFLLSEVEAELLVVDCFDMYCHACQTGAKHVNELHALVQEYGVGDRIKFVGLGINNTPLETSTFQRKFDVPFPVFPDRYRDVSDQFGRIRLPSLLVLRLEDDGWEVMHQITGTLDDPERFFLQLLEELGEKDPRPGSERSDGASCRMEGCATPADPSHEINGS